MALVLTGDTKTVLQAVSVTKTDTWVNSTGDTFVEITGLSATITPTSLSSKIIIMVQLFGATYYSSAFRIWKNGSTLSGAVGTAEGSRFGVTGRGSFLDGNHSNMMGMNYTDSPATVSPVTYSVAGSGYGSYPIYINRSVSDYNGASTYGSRGISSLILLEVSA